MTRSASQFPRVKHYVNAKRIIRVNREKLENLAANDSLFVDDFKQFSLSLQALDRQIDLLAGVFDEC